MNRYAAAGIARDAEDGRRVLVVSRTQLIARDAFDQVLEYSTAAERISRANGRELIHFPSGGRVHFTSTQSQGQRGLSVDVVFVEWDAGADDYRIIEQLLPCIAASPRGELIRA